MFHFSLLLEDNLWEAVSSLPFGALVLVAKVRGCWAKAGNAHRGVALPTCRSFTQQRGDSAWPAAITDAGV